MKKLFIYIINTFLLIFFSIGELNAQSDAEALAAADTSRFSTNKMGGWELYNAFFNTDNSDSIQAEIIVRHTNDLSWSQEQYIGKIKPGNLIPKQSQIQNFKLLNNEYALRIDSNGGCYVRLINGQQITGQIAILPIRVTYKQ